MVWYDPRTWFSKSSGGGAGGGGTGASGNISGYDPVGDLSGKATKITPEMRSEWEKNAKAKSAKGGESIGGYQSTGGVSRPTYQPLSFKWSARDEQKARQQAKKRFSKWFKPQFSSLKEEYAHKRGSLKEETSLLKRQAKEGFGLTKEQTEAEKGRTSEEARAQLESAEAESVETQEELRLTRREKARTAKEEISAFSGTREEFNRESLQERELIQSSFERKTEEGIASIARAKTYTLERLSEQVARAEMGMEHELEKLTVEQRNQLKTYSLEERERRLGLKRRMHTEIAEAVFQAEASAFQRYSVQAEQKWQQYSSQYM
jgi:hypothetical protein